jgi:phytoene synthase
VLHRYAIPVAYAEQLLDGVARDLSPARYATFDELAAYCYGVASTVGLMAMHIIGLAPGATWAQAVPAAVKLGVALQLTNILRDVGEDWAQGRLYLPLDELAAFGLADADLARIPAADPRWRRFMRFQVTRCRRLYAEALPGVRLLHPRGRLAVAAAAELYLGLLVDLRAHGYDAFTRRAHLSAWGRLRRLPGLWWRWR